MQDPYARRGGDNPPLKVGMWVTAFITGRTLKDVFVIPRVAVREGDEVLLIDKEERLRSRTVKIVWGGPDHVIVTEGLKSGELLCTVPLHYAVEGSLVKVKQLPMPKITIPGTAVPAFQTSSPAAGRAVKPAGDKQGS